MDLVTKGVKMFGHTGSGPGCFRDPAGLAVDRLPCSVSIFLARATPFSVGNMLVADSKNHRLCLHDSNGRFLTEVIVMWGGNTIEYHGVHAQVKLDPSPKRPSGLLLDQENGDIYLLNLQVFGVKNE